MCTHVRVCVRARADVTSCGHQGSANMEPFRVQYADMLGVLDAAWYTMHVSADIMRRVPRELIRASQP